MPTPVLYEAMSILPFDNDLHPALATSTVDVLYFTDRAPERDEAGNLGYGIERSNSAAMGRVTVAIGDDTPWQELEGDASSAVRSSSLNLTIAETTELVRAPPTPYPYRYENGRFFLPDALQEQVDETFKTAGTILRDRLDRTPRKEAYIYVHGVANSFEDAAFAAAELWHFFGREGVPFVYTWPAGYKGLLRGYTYDRESSEFTVTHFKNFLLGLSRFEELEKIHIIAHSRGTDIVSSALRELFNEARVAGFDPRERYRIDNVVLAAPDLDYEVVQQKLASARLAFGVRRLTLYTSKQDKAIGAALTLFASRRRLGQLDEAALDDHMARVLAQTPNVAIIEYVGKKGGDYGHNYFRTNPAVASDLVLTLRYDRDPGAENGRPLTPKINNFWEIDDDYLTGASASP